MHAPLTNRKPVLRPRRRDEPMSVERARGASGPWRLHLSGLVAQLAVLLVLMSTSLIARDVRASGGGVEAMARMSLNVLAAVDTEGSCSVDQPLEVQGVRDPCVAALMRAGSFEQRLQDGTIGMVDQLAHRCSVSLEAMFAELRSQGRRGTTAEEGAPSPHVPAARPIPTAPELPWVACSEPTDLPLAWRSRISTTPRQDVMRSRGSPLPPLPPPKLRDAVGSGLRA